MLTSFLRSCNRIASAATVGLFAVGTLVLVGTTGPALSHSTPGHQLQTAAAAQSGNPTGVFGWD